MLTSIKIPIHLFMQNPEKQIKTILGDDINILSYRKHQFQTSNQEYVIEVEYEFIDINPFSIYQITEVKQFSTISDKHVAIVENIKNREEKTEAFVSKLKKGDLVTLVTNTLDNKLIKYVGMKLFKPNHDFCTIFGNEKLSYHGTKLTQPSIKNFKSVKKGPIDIPITSTLDNYTYNYFELKYFTQNIKPEEIEYENLSNEELLKKLCEKKKGFYILNDFNILYFENNDYEVDKQMVEYLILTLSYDYENQLVLNTLN